MKNVDDLESINNKEMRTCLKESFKTIFLQQEKEKNKGNAFEAFCTTPRLLPNALYNNTIHHLHIFWFSTTYLFLVFVLFLCFFSSFSLEDFILLLSFPFVFCLFVFRHHFFYVLIQLIFLVFCYFLSG